MVAVAQWLEYQTVDLGVVGSSPISHPFAVVVFIHIIHKNLRLLRAFIPPGEALFGWAHFLNLSGGSSLDVGGSARQTSALLR